MLKKGSYIQEFRPWALLFPLPSNPRGTAATDYHLGYSYWDEKDFHSGSIINPMYVIRIEKEICEHRFLICIQKCHAVINIDILKTLLAEIRKDSQIFLPLHEYFHVNA